MVLQVQHAEAVRRRRRADRDHRTQRGSGCLQPREMRQLIL